MDEKRFAGRGGAPGAAVGIAHVARDVSAVMAVPRGSVLVTRMLHPHLAPLLTRVSGIVVEEGALLQHAATLAREFDVPAVVGLTDATTIFRSGDVLEIDGDTGVVVVRPR